MGTAGDLDRDHAIVDVLVDPTGRVRVEVAIRKDDVGGCSEVVGPVHDVSHFWPGNGPLLNSAGFADEVTFDIPSTMQTIV